MPTRAPTFVPRNKRESRGTAASRGYDAAWKKLRDWFLAANPLCLHCERAGVVRPADMVDHVVALGQGGERLDPANLQSLCWSHHAIKTRREG